MEKLIYQDKDTIIEKNVTDLKSEEFLKHCISIMQMLWYSNEHIRKALKEATVD